VVTAQPLLVVVLPLMLVVLRRYWQACPGANKQPPRMQAQAAHPAQKKQQPKLVPRCCSKDTSRQCAAIPALLRRHRGPSHLLGYMPCAGCTCSHRASMHGAQALQDNCTRASKAHLRLHIRQPPPAAHAQPPLVVPAKPPALAHQPPPCRTCAAPISPKLHTRAKSFVPTPLLPLPAQTVC
jgi:hypothetical protein